MSCFMLYDELERDFESLESEPARHAAALAAYCLLGQACSQRMTDGVVAQSLIRKKLSAWPVAMASAAVADLVAIGKWTPTESGDFLFVDWDVSQFTRAQEQERRRKQNERQRRRRQKKIEVSENVTRDVARDVTGGVTLSTPLHSSPTSSLPSVEKSASAPHPIAKAKAKRAANPAFDAVVDVLREEYAKRYDADACPSSFNGGLVAKLVKWAGGDIEKLRSSLAAFLDDPYWQGQGSPFAVWAGEPTKYLRKVQATRPKEVLGIVNGSTTYDW